MGVLKKIENERADRIAQRPKAEVPRRGYGVAGPKPQLARRSNAWPFARFGGRHSPGWTILAVPIVAIVIGALFVRLQNDGSRQNDGDRDWWQAVK
jgi:hypothetical protein